MKSVKSTNNYTLAYTHLNIASILPNPFKTSTMINSEKNERPFELSVTYPVMHAVIIYYLIVGNLIVHAYCKCNEHVNAAEVKNS